MWIFFLDNSWIKNVSSGKERGFLQESDKMQLRRRQSPQKQKQEKFMTYPPSTTFRVPRWPPRWALSVPLLSHTIRCPYSCRLDSLDDRKYIKKYYNAPSPQRLCINRLFIHSSIWSISVFYFNPKRTSFIFVFFLYKFYI